MRDILLVILFVGSLPFILKRPYVGVLVWSVFSYMNPHRLVFGFAYSIPFAQIVVVVSLLSFLFSSEPKKIPINSTTVIWLIFIAWTSVTTIFAIYPDKAVLGYIQFFKIQFMTFITLMLMTSLDRIRKLIWVIVLSIGFYSVKGGVFTIVTGGFHRVWGPPGSYIEENNALALATLMIIPFLFYLYQTSRNKWIRVALVFGLLMSLASALGSQSRGAFLAIMSVGLFFWLKSQSKFLSGMIIIILSFIGYSFMPQSWHDRMDTITNYQEDRSAMGRLNAWEYNINLANDRLTGGGFRSESPETYILYAPDTTNFFTAHSIYFGILGDHGWLGLFLFALLMLKTWTNLQYAISMSKRDQNLREINLLARMLQIALIAYFTGGAFLSLAYFDLPWHLLAISLLLSGQLRAMKMGSNK